MRILNSVFSVYIKSSIHVGLMVLCMFEITALEWSISPSTNLRFFVLFGTIVAYNFAKYFSFLQEKIRVHTLSLKAIIVISILSFGYALFNFLQLTQLQQLVGILSSVLLLLYTIPFTRSNFRNTSGIKIHIVALCWTLMTVVVPLVGSVSWDNTLLWMTIAQRYFWVLLATLPFEIYDFNKDSKTLGTIPQVVGIPKTKRLGYMLAFLIFGVTLFNETTVWWSYSIMLLLYLFFLATTSEKQTYYRNSFWVEAIPLVLWIQLYLQR